MASNVDAGDIDPFMGVLAKYSLVIYLLGLLVISVPLVLAWGPGIVVPATARVVIVGVSLAVMVATYVAERRIVFDDGDGREPTSEYSLRTRAAVVAAIVGLAAGVYIAVEVDPIYGFLFILGAYLFSRMAFKGEGDGDGR